MAREMGLGVVAWGPLAGGVLSDKYKWTDLDPSANSGPPKFDTRKAVNIASGRLNDRALTIAAEAEAVAQELSRPATQVALAWTLLNPAVTSTLIGARTFAQFKDNLAALDVTFDDKHLVRLEAASRVEMGFPHDMINSQVTAKQLFGGVSVPYSMIDACCASVRRLGARQDLNRRRIVSTIFGVKGGLIFMMSIFGG